MSGGRLAVCKKRIFQNVCAVFAIACLLPGCTRRQVYSTSADTVSASTESININTATADDFDRLPGIGRTGAEAIVAYRTKNGPFRRVEHLMQIRGISEQRYLEIRHLLTSE